MTPIYPDFCAAMLSKSVLATNYDPAKHDSLDIPNYQFGAALLKAPLPSGPFDTSQFDRWSGATNIAFAFDDGLEKLVVIVNRFDIGRASTEFFYEGYVFAFIGSHWVNVFDGAVARGYISRLRHNRLNALALMYLKAAFWLLVSQTAVMCPSALSRGQSKRVRKRGIGLSQAPQFAMLKLTVTKSTDPITHIGSTTKRRPLAHAHIRRGHYRTYKGGKVVWVDQTVIAKGKPFKPILVIK